MFLIQPELIQPHPNVQNIAGESRESEDNGEFLGEFVGQDFENSSLLEDVDIKNHKENERLNILNQSSEEDNESGHQLIESSDDWDFVLNLAWVNSSTRMSNRHDGKSLLLFWDFLGMKSIQWETSTDETKQAVPVSVFVLAAMCWHQSLDAESPGDFAQSLGLRVRCHEDKHEWEFFSEKIEQRRVQRSDHKILRLNEFDCGGLDLDGEEENSFHETKMSRNFDLNTVEVPPEEFFVP